MGGSTPSWDNVVTVWGNLRPLDGKEKSMLGHISSTITHEITVRFRDDLTSQGANYDTYNYDMIIEKDGREFAIQYVYNENEKNKYFRMLASEQN